MAMKNLYFNVIGVTIFLFFIFNLHAQDAEKEWLWAKGYYGYNDDLLYNQIRKSAFDEDGNIYVFGMFWDPAMIDGELIFQDWIQSESYPGQFLAKFDINGNMLWKKVIKYNANTCRGKWMYLRGDRIYLLADIEMGGSGDLNGGLYYLDTLVRLLTVLNTPPEERVPPFDLAGWRSAFITFDLDGNVVDQKFVQYEDRGRPLRWPFISQSNTPFHVDASGNIYICSIVEFTGDDPSKPLYTIIDNERRDSFYIPETVPGEARLDRHFLFKFSPDFNLLWVKPFIHHTEGLSPISYSDTINPWHDFTFYGLSADEEDNLYFSGYIRAVPSSQYFPLCQYPVYFYWDSIHYNVIYDQSSARYQPFLIKYDTAGNVLWNQQLYTNGSGQIHQFFNGNTVNEHSVFVAAEGNMDLFIDAEMQIPIPHSNNTIADYRGFYIRYDRETGNYINHGLILDAVYSSAGRDPAIINNHVIVQGRYGYANQHSNKLIAYFCDNGEFKGADTIFCLPSSLADISIKAFDILVHESGHLFTYFWSNGERATFGNITVQGGPKSTAYFGMMYNPSLLIPYDTNVVVSELPAASACFILYPNPTGADIHIRLLVEEERFEKAELYTLQGQKLGEYKSLNIPASKLSSGVYLVKIYIDNQIITEKFLKN